MQTFDDLLNDDAPSWLGKNRATRIHRVWIYLGMASGSAVALLLMAVLGLFS